VEAHLLQRRGLARRGDGERRHPPVLQEEQERRLAAGVLAAHVERQRIVGVLAADDHPGVGAGGLHRRREQPLHPRPADGRPRVGGGFGRDGAQQTATDGEQQQGDPISSDHETGWHTMRDMGRSLGCRLNALPQYFGVTAAVNRGGDALRTSANRRRCFVARVRRRTPVAGCRGPALTALLRKIAKACGSTHSSNGQGSIIGPYLTDIQV